MRTYSIQLGQGLLEMDENLTEAVNALKRAYQLAVEHKGTFV